MSPFGGIIFLYSQQQKRKETFMQNLAQKYPETYTNLTATGYESLSKMMNIFYRCVDMDRALGTNSSVNNWMIQRNMPSRKYENMAQIYLQNNTKQEPEKVSTPPASPAVSAPDDVTFIVVCPIGSQNKVEKVLALLGCESVPL